MLSILPKPLLCWGPGHLNPSDLNSKSQPNLLQVLNGSLWRHGPPEFSHQTFPSENIVVFGYFQNGSYQWTGFKETSQHMINCARCMSIETGHIVAGELTHHSAVLLTSCDARKQTEVGNTAAVTEPVSGGTTVTSQAGQPGPSSTGVDRLPPTDCHLPGPVTCERFW